MAPKNLNPDVPVVTDLKMGDYVTVTSVDPSWVRGRCPCKCHDTNNVRVGQTFRIWRLEVPHYESNRAADARTDNYYFGSSAELVPPVSGYGQLRRATPDEEAAYRPSSKPGS